MVNGWIRLPTAWFSGFPIGTILQCDLFQVHFRRKYIGFVFFRMFYITETMIPSFIQVERQQWLLHLVLFLPAMQLHNDSAADRATSYWLRQLASMTVAETITSASTPVVAYLGNDSCTNREVRLALQMLANPLVLDTFTTNTVPKASQENLIQIKGIDHSQRKGQSIWWQPTVLTQLVPCLLVEQWSTCPMLWTGHRHVAYRCRWRVSCGEPQKNFATKCSISHANYCIQIIQTVQIIQAVYDNKGTRSLSRDIVACIASCRYLCLSGSVYHDLPVCLFCLNLLLSPRARSWILQWAEVNWFVIVRVVLIMNEYEYLRHWWPSSTSQKEGE